MRVRFWKRPETRSSWADAVAQLKHLIAGSDYADAVETAASEIAAGVIERAFASATVTGASDLIAAPLNPCTLAYVGRQLTKHGESCHMIRTSSGKLELLPAQNWEVYGLDPDPDTWMYDIYVPTPNAGQFSRRVSALDVVHVRTGASRDTPWSGRSALRNAADLGTSHARIESSVSKELKGAAGRVLPAPLDPRNDPGKKAIQNALNAIVGGPLVVESMASGHGNILRSEGRMSSDWMQRRIGPDPPAAVVELRNDLQVSAGIALGIPAELLRSDASAQARREAWRQCYFGTVLPLARLLQNELRYKLESPELTIRLDELGAADLQARGRSLKSMVDSGVKLKRAMRLCGLD